AASSGELCLEQIRYYMALALPPLEALDIILKIGSKLGSKIGVELLSGHQLPAELILVRDEKIVDCSNDRKGWFLMT
ncbi:hypothetical protein PMAYCL1PPCAC_05196, partial [Pristionchus mayeri]